MTPLMASHKEAGAMGYNNFYNIRYDMDVIIYGLYMICYNFYIIIVALQGGGIVRPLLERAQARAD